MKTALFTNFSEEAFTGYWNGKGKTFQPGQSVYMPDYLAKHFAKHLTNRELLRVRPDGSPVYKDGEKMTSPKFPEQVPLYMELFNKAYTPDDEEDDFSNESDPIETAIAVANKNREKEGRGAKQNPNEPQVVISPDFEDDDDVEAPTEEPQAQPAATQESKPAGAPSNAPVGLA